jgi:hypothetical protein
VEHQKKNILYTRCHISNEICSMIIDNRSCANVVSITLIKKLSPNTIKHVRYYRLQWLNECVEVRVTKKVLISFLVGKSV